MSEVLHPQHVKAMADRITQMIGANSSGLLPKVEAWKSAVRNDDKDYPHGYYLYEVHFTPYYQMSLDGKRHVTTCPSLRAKFSVELLDEHEVVCWAFAREYLKNMKRVRAY